MRHFYPRYYRDFHCIAADCPDSCCQGWDVVIDPDTEAKYRQVGGELGDKLRSLIYTDSDGDRVFRLCGDKKCPFWGEDRLCDIYRELGEAYLCNTCARFPRLSMEFADFTEHSLAPACPEAARLILLTDHACDGFVMENPSGCEDYSAELMQKLTAERTKLAAILTDELPLSERLTNALHHAERVQRSILPYEESGDPDDHALTALYASLEYIEQRNRRAIAGCRPNLRAFAGRERELTRLALCYLYRYFLTAADTLDVLTPVKLTVSAVLLTAALCDSESISLVEAAQRFSKETEQSYENMERLQDGLAQIPVGYFAALLSE